MTEQNAGAETVGETTDISAHGKASAKKVEASDERLSPAEENRIGNAITESKRQAAAPSKISAQKPGYEKRPQSNRLFAVTDSSATTNNRKRTHDIIIDGDIKSVDFEYNKPTMLPFAEAMKFQKEGFVVKDEDGNIILAPTEMSIDSMTQFGPDKVVAHLHELTQESLYARAATLPGGEDFNPRAAKGELIAFLTSTATKKIKENRRQSDDMAPADLDNLIHEAA